MSPTIRVAIVQDEVAPDLARGLEATDNRAADAARAGAALVAFPETWLPGYPAWLDVCRDAATLGSPARQGRLSADGRAERRRRRGIGTTSSAPSRGDTASRWSSAWSSASSAGRHAARCSTHCSPTVPTARCSTTIASSSRRTPSDSSGDRATPTASAPSTFRCRGLRTRRRARVLGALDAARASGAARLGRRHPRRRVADREGDAPDRESALRVRGTLLRARRRLAHARVRASAGARAASGHRASGDQFVLRGGSAIIAP